MPNLVSIIGAGKGGGHSGGHFRVLVDIRRSDPESSSIDVEIWRLECDQSDTLEILANVDFCRLLVEVEYRNAFGDWISRV